MSILRILLMSAGGGVILIAAIGGFGGYAVWGLIGGVLLVLLAAIAKESASKENAEFVAWKAQRDAQQRKEWESKVRSQQ